MSRVLHTPNPDPAVAPDAGQFLLVRLLDHVANCSDEDCACDTRVEIGTDAIKPLPYCTAHAHVMFADWMVGV